MGQLWTSVDDTKVLVFSTRRGRFQAGEDRRVSDPKVSTIPSSDRSERRFSYRIVANSPTTVCVGWQATDVMLENVMDMNVVGSTPRWAFPNRFDIASKAHVARHSGLNTVIAQTSRHRLDDLQRLDVKVGTRGMLTIAHMFRDSSGHGVTDAQEKVDGYAACVFLRALDECTIWCEGRVVASGTFNAGEVHIANMRHQWSADIQSAFEVVNFCVSQSSLDELADEESILHIGELHCPMNPRYVDPVLANLARVLLPALARPDEANRLFADHVARAVVVHLTQTYGTSLVKSRGPRGGLAPWQERRAKELLQSDLSGGMSLAALANACRLSSSQFSQAFKQTVGCPPHQWLLQQRVERAKYLILNSKCPLSEVALATGFSDQSHFTRVFTQRVKMSPGAWRRELER